MIYYLKKKILSIPEEEFRNVNNIDLMCDLLHTQYSVFDRL